MESYSRVVGEMGSPGLRLESLGAHPARQGPSAFCVRTFAMMGDHEAAPASSSYAAFCGKLPFKTQWLQDTYKTTWGHHKTGEIFLRKKGLSVTNCGAGTRGRHLPPIFFQKVA